MKRGLITAAVIAAALICTTSASAQGVTVPESWAGIWELEETSHTCGMNDNNTEMSTDTLCAGPVEWTDIFDETGLEGSFDCEGTITDTNADISCSGQFESEGFTVTLSIEMHMTRSGDSYSGTQTTSFEYTGDPCDLIPGGCGVLNTCQVIDITADRTGPAPPDCSTPVEPMTWGQIKAFYR